MRLKLKLSWKTKGLLCLVIVCAGGFAYFLQTPTGKKVTATVKDGMALIHDKAGLRLSNVKVSRSTDFPKTPLSQINEITGLTQNMPIFDVDLDEIKQKVETLPWIETVVVERHLPNTLFIRITEKTPVAMWQNKKQYWPIDKNGKIIKDNETKLSGVLLVVGSDAAENAPALIELLQHYPEIYNATKSAVRIGNRRWDLMLNDAETGLKVQLPDSDMEKALERLEEKRVNEDILSADLSLIDLRTPGRFIVQAGTQKKGKK